MDTQRGEFFCSWIMQKKNHQDFLSLWISGNKIQQERKKRHCTATQQRPASADLANDNKKYQLLLGSQHKPGTATAHLEPRAHLSHKKITSPSAPRISNYHLTSWNTAIRLEEMTSPSILGNTRSLFSLLMPADPLGWWVQCPDYPCTDQEVNISAVTRTSAKDFIQSPAVVHEYAAAKSLLPLTLWGDSKGKQGSALVITLLRGRYNEAGDVLDRVEKFMKFHVYHSFVPTKWGKKEKIQFLLK